MANANGGYAEIPGVDPNRDSSASVPADGTCVKLQYEHLDRDQTATAGAGNQYEELRLGSKRWTHPNLADSTTMLITFDSHVSYINSYRRLWGLRQSVSQSMQFLRRYLDTLLQLMTFDSKLYIWNLHVHGSALKRHWPVSVTHGDTILLSVTSPNANRFSEFFHSQTWR